MKKIISCVLGVICLVLLVPVSGSCGGPSEPDNPFVELLALMPASAREGRVITIIDYRVFRQLQGISVYDEDGQRINREEYFENIVALDQEDSLYGYDIMRFSSYWTGCGEYVLSSPIQDESVGYEATDVDAEINNIYSLSDLPWILGSNEISPNPDAMIAAIGDFDSQATNDALINSDEWPSWALDNYTSVNYQEYIIYSWGDSLEYHIHDRFSPPHLDSIGRAIPLTISDGHLFIGSNLDYIKSMIDAKLDETSSLADIPEYVLAAQGMYELGAIGALIMDEAHVRDILSAFSPTTGPTIQDFLTVGMGPGKDETGEYVALVLVYENAVDAEEGISLLEQKIEAFNIFCDTSDCCKDNYIHDTAIYTDGRLLLARLYTGNQILWRYWFFNQWAIVYSEESVGN